MISSFLHKSEEEKMKKLRFNLSETVKKRNKLSAISDDANKETDHKELIQKGKNKFSFFSSTTKSIEKAEVKMTNKRKSVENLINTQKRRLSSTLNNMNLSKTMNFNFNNSKRKLSIQNDEELIAKMRKERDKRRRERWRKQLSYLGSQAVIRLAQRKVMTLIKSVVSTILQESQKNALVQIKILHMLRMEEIKKKEDLVNNSALRIQRCFLKYRKRRQHIKDEMVSYLENIAAQLYEEENEQKLKEEITLTFSESFYHLVRLDARATVAAVHIQRLWRGFQGRLRAKIRLCKLRKLESRQLRRKRLKTANESINKKSAKEKESVDIIRKRAWARQTFRPQSSLNKSIYLENKAIIRTKHEDIGNILPELSIPPQKPPSYSSNGRKIQRVPISQLQQPVPKDISLNIWVAIPIRTTLNTPCSNSTSISCCKTKMRRKSKEKPKVFRKRDQHYTVYYDWLPAHVFANDHSFYRENIASISDFNELFSPTI